MAEVNYKKMVAERKSEICHFRDWFSGLSGNQTWRLKASDTHIICERLHEKYTVDDMKTAVKGMRQDPMINSKNCHRLSLALGSEWIEFRMKEGKYEEAQEVKHEENTQLKQRHEEKVYGSADKDSLLRQYIDRMRSDRAIKSP